MVKGKITPSNVLNFNKKTRNDKKSQSDRITIENITSKVSSDNVSDAMKNLYGKHYLIRNVKAINNEDKVSGFIRTVETNSDDWGTCIKGIYACKKDEILFIKCSDEKYAVWGELASTAAKKHGVKATVIVGSSRDTNDIIKLGYPVFSRSTQSRAGFAFNKGVIGEQIIVDDGVIKTGDFVVCDVDGVVIVPSEKLEEVIEEVNNIKEFEEDCINKLFDENKQLDDILGL